MRTTGNDRLVPAIAFWRSNPVIAGMRMSRTRHAGRGGAGPPRYEDASQKDSPAYPAARMSRWSAFRTDASSSMSMTVPWPTPSDSPDAKVSPSSGEGNWTNVLGSLSYHRTNSDEGSAVGGPSGRGGFGGRSRPDGGVPAGRGRDLRAGRGGRFPSPLPARHHLPHLASERPPHRRPAHDAPAAVVALPRRRAPRPRGRRARRRLLPRLRPRALHDQLSGGPRRRGNHSLVERQPGALRHAAPGHRLRGGRGLPGPSPLRLPR